MKATPTLGQKAQSMFTAHPVIAGVIGLAAIIGIGLGIKSKIASSSTTS